jgi:hypothetical protein
VDYAAEGSGVMQYGVQADAYNMPRLINWYGLVGSLIAFAVVVISLFNPWWQLTVGNDLMKVNASPVNTNFGLFGTPFAIPLISTLNIISFIMMCLSGSAMLIYSISPTKSYAKDLLGFAYKKPLFTIILFAAGLLAISLGLQFEFGMNIPLFGSGILNLPTAFTGNALISAQVTGTFLWPFWLAIVVAVLFIGARIQHRKIEEIVELEKRRQQELEEQRRKEQQRKQKYPFPPRAPLRQPPPRSPYRY